MQNGHNASFSCEHATLQCDFLVAFHQDRASVSPSLESGPACNLLWSREYGGNDAVRAQASRACASALLGTLLNCDEQSERACWRVTDTWLVTPTASQLLEVQLPQPPDCHLFTSSHVFPPASAPRYLLCCMKARFQKHRRAGEASGREEAGSPGVWR